LKFPHKEESKWRLYKEGRWEEVGGVTNMSMIIIIYQKSQKFRKSTNQIKMVALMCLCVCVHDISTFKVQQYIIKNTTMVYPPQIICFIFYYIDGKKWKCVLFCLIVGKPSS